MKKPTVALTHDAMEVASVDEEYALVAARCEKQRRSFSVLLQTASRQEDGRMADLLYVETAPLNRPLQKRVELFSFIVTPDLMWRREPVTLQQKVEQAVVAEDWPKVLQLCADRLASQPDHGFALYWTGQASRFLGDPQGALGAFEKAWPRTPRGVGILTSMAVFMAGQHLAAGDGRRAIEIMRRATEAEPEEPTGWNTLGICLRRTGEPGPAMQSFERGLEVCVQKVLAEARERGLWPHDGEVSSPDANSETLSWAVWRLRGERVFSTLLMNGWRLLMDEGQVDRAFRTLLRASLCRTGEDLQPAFEEHRGRRPFPPEVEEAEAFDRLIVIDQWKRLESAASDGSSTTH